MDNPFRFSGVVDDPAFCNRIREQEELKRYIQSSQNVLLYSHRRYGKSSLILKLFKALKKITPVYVDLYGTTSVEDFIASLLKGISTVEPKMNRLMKMLREGIRSITLNFSVDPITGMPVATPVFKRSVEYKTVNEILALLVKLSKKNRMVVAFDEFQEVAGYGGDVFEKLLRNAMQHHQRISYIFAGSQRHLITEMFNDRKRAFYKIAASFPLDKIETVDYIEWISGLYRKSKRKIEYLMIEDVVNRCENHPKYVQEFFFHLWAEPQLSIEVLDQVEHRIIQDRVPEFSYAWDALTLNQRKALKLIAGTLGKNIFAAENLAAFGFRTASQASAALKKLEKGGFLDKNRKWKIHDPVFYRWLQAV